MNALRKILLVEDDERDVELTLRALRSNGPANRIDVVRDGEEALEYLTRGGRFRSRPAGLPVLVLLDIKMPKVDGLELLKQIRAIKDLQFVPVVILTSSKEQTDLLESYKNGANAYVVKPVNFVEFVESVKQIGRFWAAVNVLPEHYRERSASA